MLKNQIAGLNPTGPHVEGIIRFTREEDLKGSTEQKSLFELLTRVHSETPLPGAVPKMVPHPLGEKISGIDSESGERRLLNEIPIRFMFDKPENNLTASYKAFSKTTGQLMCSGNGEDAVRRSATGVAPSCVSCRGPENCIYALNEDVTCKLNVRLKVQVEGSENPFAVMEFQSSGMNSYLTLSATLKLLHTVYSGLRGIPLRLTSYGLSSVGSGYEQFHCANIELREGSTLLATKTLTDANRLENAWIDHAALELVQESLADSSDFALNGTESIVSCWTPASEIKATLNKSSSVPASSTSVSSIQEMVIRCKKPGDQTAPEIDSSLKIDVPTTERAPILETVIKTQTVAMEHPATSTLAGVDVSEDQDVYI